MDKPQDSETTYQAPQSSKRPNTGKHRPCVVSSCKAALGYPKVHAMVEHVPGIFDENLDPRDTLVNKTRMDALLMAAFWILGKPSSLLELAQYMSENIEDKLVAGCRVSAKQDEAMREFCNYLGLDVPEAFNLKPLNSPAVLLNWRILLGLCNHLDVEEQAYWKSYFTADASAISQLPSCPVTLDVVGWAV